MEICPQCGYRVDQLHPIPPDVFTKDLLEAFRDVDTPDDLELCGNCLIGLVDGPTA